MHWVQKKIICNFYNYSITLGYESGSLLGKNCNSSITMMIHSTIKASCWCFISTKQQMSWCSISTKQKQQMNKHSRPNLHCNNTILEFSYKDNNATHSRNENNKKTKDSKANLQWNECAKYKNQLLTFVQMMTKKNNVKHI